MKTSFRILAVSAIALVAAPASADSAGVGIQAQVSAACSVSLVSPSQITSPPLLIHANVQRNCNAVHTISVTYLPTNPTNPSSLVMVFNGNSPTSGVPGTVTFANLPATDSISLLTIAYSGPPPELEEIARSFAIEVSVP